MVVISGSTLERIRFACIGWGAVFNDNIRRLDTNLLKLSALPDVDLTRYSGLADKDVLRYDNSLDVWYNSRSGFLTTTTTTS